MIDGVLACILSFFVSFFLSSFAKMDCYQTNIFTLKRRNEQSMFNPLDISFVS